MMMILLAVPARDAGTVGFYAVVVLLALAMVYCFYKALYHGKLAKLHDRVIKGIEAYGSMHDWMWDLAEEKAPIETRSAIFSRLNAISREMNDSFEKIRASERQGPNEVRAAIDATEDALRKLSALSGRFPAVYERCDCRNDGVACGS